MRMKFLCGIAAATGMACAVLVTSASAAPMNALERTAPAAIGQVEAIHYGGGRDHCHWRNGRKWCNGGYSRRSYGPSYGYYGYNRRPGVSLYLNFGGKRHNRWR